MVIILRFSSQLANGSLYISSVYTGSPELTGSYQCLATVDDVGSIVSRSATIKLASEYRKNCVALIESFSYQNKVFDKNYC